MAGMIEPISPAAALAELSGRRHPPPALLVRPGRRLNRQLEALEQHVVGHLAFEVETLAHRPGRREQCVGLFEVEVHRAIVAGTARRDEAADRGRGSHIPPLSSRLVAPSGTKRDQMYGCP
jgi:hypothetical protein